MPYVMLSSEAFETTVYSGGWLAVTAVATIALIIVVVIKLVGGDVEPEAILLWAGAAAAGGVLLWQSWYRVMGFYAGDQPLVFAVDRPSHAQYERFLSELRSRRVAHLRNLHLLQATGSSVADELQKLVWLRENNAITDQEYERLKQQLLGKGQWPGTPWEFSN